MKKKIQLSPAPSPMVPCVNRPECAALLDVSLRTVDRMIADREIPFHHVRGKLVRFKVSDVEAYQVRGASRTGNRATEKVKF